MGNTSSIRVHFPASYVRLQECRKVFFVNSLQDLTHIPQGTPLEDTPEISPPVSVLEFRSLWVLGTSGLSSQGTWAKSLTLKKRGAWKTRVDELSPFPSYPTNFWHILSQKGNSEKDPSFNCSINFYGQTFSNWSSRMVVVVPPMKKISWESKVPPQSYPPINKASLRGY